MNKGGFVFFILFFNQAEIANLYKIIPLWRDKNLLKTLDFL